MPPGEGKAIPTPGPQGLLYGTELNNFLVERRQLGLGCSSGPVLWMRGCGRAEARCPLGVVVPGRCPALRRRGENRAGGLQAPRDLCATWRPAPALLRLLGRWVSGCGDLSWTFTLSSGCPSEDCKIYPIPWIPRTFRKTLSQTPLLRLTLTPSWKCPVAVIKSRGDPEPTVLSRSADGVLGSGLVAA